jgi:CheY-like chemotaxis protein
MSIQKPRCRVLVVEDEAAVSILIEDMLADFGTEIIGPAGGMDEALRLAGKENLDLAILDINLRGQETYPVAEVLGTRGIPFIFATGYSTAALPERFRDSPRLQKPFSLRSFQDTLKEALIGRPCHTETSPV